MIQIRRRKLLKIMGTSVAALVVNGRSMMKVAEGAPVGIEHEAAGPTKTISEKIAEFVVGASFEDLPPSVIEKAKALIVYHFGLAFAGLFNEEATQIREIARQIDQPGGGATVIGERFRLLPSDAAFANTTLMRATARDDVIFPSGIHPGGITLPTALAIGEVKRVSGREMVLALALGYEVLGKLGSAARGWGAPMPRSSTMIYGGFGPVTVAGRLLNLDQERMANAIAMGASLGMGVNEGGPMDHMYSYISRKATFAALIAEAGGAVFAKNTIEGELGLYRSFFGEVPAKLDDLIGGLGSDWEILGAEYKPHHGTGSNTVAIELLLALATEHKLTVDQVTKIDVFLPVARVGRKAYAFTGPFATTQQAYRSLPYALSVALVYGKVASERYTESAIQDETVTAMARNVTLGYEEGHEVTRYCRLEVHTADGRKLVREGSYFMFPFPPSDWGPWLQKDGKRVLSLEQLQRLEHIIGDLENLDDVSKLMATVVPRGATPQRLGA